MAAIDRRADRPVYKQVADDLRKRIVSREFAPGAPALGTPTAPSMADELARLATLRSEGAISNDEYVRAKELALSS